MFVSLRVEKCGGELGIEPAFGWCSWILNLLDHGRRGRFSECAKPTGHFLGCGVTGNLKTGIDWDDRQTQLAWDSGSDRDDSFNPVLLEMAGEAVSVFGIATDQDEKVSELMRAALCAALQ